MLLCLTKFNEEVFRKEIHEEGDIDGCEDTRKEDLLKTIQILKELLTPKDTAISQLMTHYDLTVEEATDLVNSHWD